MKVVTICLPESYIDGMDRLIKNEMYPNRSEVIRIAIRDLLLEELWGRKDHRTGRPLVTQLERFVEVQDHNHE